MLAWPVAIAAQTGSPSGPALDPSSPMEPMTDLGVDWPDADMIETLPGEPPASGDAPPAGNGKGTPIVNAEIERRYSVTIRGLEALDEARIRAAFDYLSTLRQGEGKAANSAQIDRRAREDEGMLRQLLEAEGYYDARVTTQIDTAAAGRLTVSLQAEPGPLYRFSEVKVEGLAGAKDRRGDPLVFGIRPEDPARAEAVLAATDALRHSLADQGYPFAKVAEPAVTIDHAEHIATLSLSAEPGAFARFGDIVIRGRSPFRVKHVRRISRFRPGDPYNAADLEDLRRALVATGLVSTVRIAPVPSSQPGVVDVAVTIERAPPRTIAGEIGYGTGEGSRAEISWTHRNLIKPEGAVTFRGVAGTREQYLGASLRRANYKARDRVQTAQIAISHINRDAFNARTLTVGAGLERQTNIIWQKKWTWSIGGELAVSDERDTVLATGVSRRRTFYIVAAPASLAYDGSDDLLNPTRGFRLAGRLSPEISFHSGTFTYARAQIDASDYQPIGGNTIIAGRVRVGTIAGAKRDQIAPSRRYYAGGGGSVRGYGYQDIGPRDVDNDPIGGRSIAEFSLEARVRFGDFGVVPFFDAGNIYTSALPRFTGLQYGAGIGIRYYTNFGPIRVDLGTPLNPRKGDPRVAVYVSLGQAF